MAVHIVILTLRRWNQEHQDFKVIFGSIASLGKLGLHEIGVGLEKRERGQKDRVCICVFVQCMLK